MSTFMSDVGFPRGLTQTFTHASVASNGASALFGGPGVLKLRAPFDCRVEAVVWEPTGANNAASNTVSFRQLTILDGGADATGTVILASLNLTATLASDTVRVFSQVTGVTVASNDAIVVKQASVGAANSTHTVLQAGTFHITFWPI